MTQPEDAVPRRNRVRAVLAVGALFVLVVLGYAGWRHQHPPYYVGAMFEHVTVEPFEIACAMSGNTMSWHRITLGGDRFDLVDWDSLPPGKAVQGTLRVTAVSDLRPLTAEAEFTSGGTTTKFKAFGNKFWSMTCE